jgi:hypothetical protein
MVPVGLAVAVWAGVCPTIQPGEGYPVPAIVGCPVPVAGLIYEQDHAGIDRDARMALDRARVELDAAHAVLSEVDERWSPAVWFGLGVAAGVLSCVLYVKGAD